MKKLSLNEYLELMHELKASPSNQQTKSKTVKFYEDSALVFSFNNELGIYVSAQYRYNYEVLEYVICYYIHLKEFIIIINQINMISLS